MRKSLRKLTKRSPKELILFVQTFLPIKLSKKAQMMKIVLHPIHLWQEVAEDKPVINLKLKSLVDGMKL
jgi:hypothetical protein